jgi:hypothetical protein
MGLQTYKLHCYADSQHGARGKNHPDALHWREAAPMSIGFHQLCRFFSVVCRLPFLGTALNWLELWGPSGKRLQFTNWTITIFENGKSTN